MNYALKFSKKEYLNDIKNGKIYFNELQYFLEIEKDGQGDSREGKIRIDSFKKFRPNDKRYDMFRNLDVEEINIGFNWVKKIPIFSCSLLDDDVLQNVVFCDPVLKKDFINEMMKWGTTVMMIDLDEFIENINTRCKQLKIMPLISKIKYNQDTNIHKCDDLEKNYCYIDEQIFSKRSEFKNQNELRIALINQKCDIIKDNQNSYILNIKPLKKAYILELDDLNDLGIKKVYR